MPEQIKKILDTLVEWGTHTGIKILVALILMFVSFKLINWLGKRIIKGSKKRDLDKTITKTLAYTVKIALKCLVIICLIGYLGINTSGLTALVTSLGVCFGLAVNGALANLAGGVLIIVTRPFKLDDVIEAQGVVGTVTDIQLTRTRIVTGDNKVIYLPNGNLANDVIINYSENSTRRVDFKFSISYNADSKKAMEIIRHHIEHHLLVLEKPDVMVRVSAHTASSIEITARGWANSGDYWTVYYDVLENVRADFDKEGIEIPFEQIDVHIKNN